MKTQKQMPGSEHDEIDFSALFHQILGHWRLIALITTLTFLIGCYIAAQQTTSYQTDLILQIDSGVSKIGLGQQLLGSSQNSIATQTALIQSRVILEPVLESLGLNINTAILSKRPFWQRLFKTDHRSIHIETFNLPKNKRDMPFRLEYDAPNHVRLYDDQTHLLLQGLVGQLISDPKQNMQLKISNIQAPIGTQFTLQKTSNYTAIRSLQRRLSIQELGASGTMGVSTGLLNLKLVGGNPQEIPFTLNTIAHIAKEKDIEKKIREASQILHFLDKKLPIIRHQLAESEQKLNQYYLKSKQIERKLKTQFLLHEIIEIEKQLGQIHLNKALMKKQYTAAHPLMLALKDQTQTLLNEQQDIENRLKNIPRGNQTELHLLRDIKIKNNLYLTLLNKVQNLDFVKAGIISDLHILSKASYPIALPPSTLKIYLASLFFGIALSLGFIFGRRLLFPLVDDPHWSENRFNLANLAIIPFCKEQTLFKKESTTQTHLPLMAHVNSKNLSIEALRSLRTSLQISLATAGNNLVSILGITPGVGKSFISANLAYLLASSGKRVLLIDGDLRRGTLHKYMNIPAKPGMADLLSQEISIEDALKTNVYPHLDFLPCGTYRQDPSELLMSDTFKRLLETFSKHYDIVLIDTPPIMLVTDGILICSHTANNYLVLAAGLHQPSEIELTLKRLHHSGIPLQGTIFNFSRSEVIHRASGKYSKYHYYKYNHYYYHDESVK